MKRLLEDLRDAWRLHSRFGFPWAQAWQLARGWPR